MSFLSKLNISIRTINFLMVLTFLVGLGGSWGTWFYKGKSQTLGQASEGNSICFQRMTQSFTALMINDTSSQFLTKGFRSDTASCIQEISHLISGAAAMKVVNNFQSDYHWFSQKIGRILETAKLEKLDLSQSNILDKYKDLELLNSQLAEQLKNRTDVFHSFQSLSLAVLLLSLVSFCLLAAIATLKGRSVLSQIQNLETNLNGDFDSIHSRLFRILDAPNISNLYTSRIDAVESQNHELEDALLRMNSMGWDPTYEIDLPSNLQARKATSYNIAFNNVLDQLQGKAFEEGILLETDLNEEEFSVYSSQDSLEQFMLSLISYAMSQGKRVKIRSKVLGSVAYCKISIPEHNFSEKDLSFMNSQKEMVGVGLNLQILKELLAETSGKIALKNKRNSKDNQQTAEIEVLFERVKDDDVAQPKSNLIASGSKQEVRAFLESQL
jgi:hypothetical protein